MSEPSLEGKNWTWIFPKTPEVNLSRFAGKNTQDSTKEQAGEEQRAAGLADRWPWGWRKR